jgi:tripartite-type tricarboxylate transporter receptor subunit TctC
VRIVVGLAPGTSLDLTARIIAQWLSERFGQPVIVDDRPGAASNLATELVVKAAPDGYTLLLVSSANTTNAALYEKLNFNFLRDIAPVSSITRAQQIIVTNPSKPYKTIPEFIAYAKANPGRINLASSGVGTIGHLGGELLKRMTNIETVHVPYRGGANMLTDLIGGQMDVAFDAVSSSIEHIKAGRLRGLAVSGAARLEALPDVPTVGEFVPGYEFSVWNGIGAPKGTPTPIIEKLSAQIAEAVADPTVKARLSDLGYSMFPSSPDDFGRLIAADTEKWSKVVKAANIKPE